MVSVNRCNLRFEEAIKEAFKRESAILNAYDDIIDMISQ